MANHEDFFATTISSNVSAGDTTTPLAALPTVDAPFYLTFDASNINGHPEVVLCTSKTATNVNHAALAYAHTTDEEVRMCLVAAELDALRSSTKAYTPASAGTTTLDLSYRILTVTMPANTQTLAVTGGVTGQMFIVEIINATSQGALTWFTTIKWADGVVPILTGTNGKKDSFGFRITGTNTYDGYIIGQNI